MQYVQGNLWDFRGPDTPVCVTTNGVIKKNGELVMGAGVALQAKQKFPEIPGVLGLAVKDWGNTVIYLPKHYVISFPTKNDWRNPSDLGLIKQSAHKLLNLTNARNFDHVYLTPPGCGNGGLHWSVVEPILQALFDNRFVIVLQ